MLYFMSNAVHPVKYVSSGNLVSEHGFVHPRRNIDTFVIIVVTKGTLHITQNGIEYDVHENEFMLLLPDMLHYGHKASEGELSYYWSHFYVQDPDFLISDRQVLIEHYPALNGRTDADAAEIMEHYLIPEYGKLSPRKRCYLLFVQLLDIAKRDNHIQTYRCNYALSLILLETTNDSYQSGHFMDADVPVQVFDVMEWIRTHYDHPISVSSMAEQFNYHPTYLTSIFKKYTGNTILTYLNQTRIAAAKNLLMSNRDLHIYQVAHICGFSEAKYFMRLFKECEGITPSQYRKAFCQRKVNII